MFKDTKEGQTHHENDGCGIPEHNKMTPQQAEQIVKDTCILANPDILKLEFGCVIKSHTNDLPPIEAPIVMKGDRGWVVSDKDFGVVGDYIESQFEILGRPPRLADVMLAIQEENNLIYIDSFGVFKIWKGTQYEAITFRAQEGHMEIVRWNLLKDSLHDQSDETKLFLAGLLAGNK